jgi:hypothetical protein
VNSEEPSHLTLQSDIPAFVEMLNKFISHFNAS